ncbi:MULTISPECIES: hypothetical protein [Nocardia]|uniref:hypothetical protein n=1 Tax=Nocardia TaxID=1817 RepID=UPI000D69573D|nr:MULTISPECIES: hypothetical protein [Nocardia]
MPSTTGSRPGRLDALKALIDHPRTPDYEREAARAILARLRDQQDTPARSEYIDPTWYGAKYSEVPRFCATSVISKAIREEIKTLRKVAGKIGEQGEMKLYDPIGDAPAEIRFAVTTSRHGSITITIRDIPDEWGWVREDRHHTGHVADWPSPALRDLGRALRALANAYNHDNSDITTDYFDQRFFLNITACKGSDRYGVSVS